MTRKQKVDCYIQANEALKNVCSGTVIYDNPNRVHISNIEDFLQFCDEVDLSYEIERLEFKDYPLELVTWYESRRVFVMCHHEEVVKCLACGSLMPSALVSNIGCCKDCMIKCDEECML